MGALLAAGSSRRMGQPKQLLPFHGRSLVAHAASALCDAPLLARAVVLGAHAEDVARVLPAQGLTRLHNALHAEGMAGSVRCATTWAQGLGADALLLAVADQPALEGSHLIALCDALRTRELAVASRYAGKLGVPALFGAAWFVRLATLSGDRGAAGLLRGDAQVIAIDWPEGAVDIDTPEDLGKLA